MGRRRPIAKFLQKGVLNSRRFENLGDYPVGSSLRVHILAVVNEGSHFEFDCIGWIRARMPKKVLAHLFPTNCGL